MLRHRLRHTWPHFFARYGNFTEVQRRAIPSILDGANVLVSAPTASGKTEAVVAPLLERLRTGERELRLLYICPTRALVRDLYQRLAPILEAMHVPFAMKSGDTGPVSTQRPPLLLITTPESTDSLLTRAPRLFIPLRAVVLDEIHLFDEGPRGDHLRCLLRRIERIRDYAHDQAGTDAPPLQRIALSATVPDAATIAGRYLGTDATLVTVSGGREIVADLWPGEGLDELVAALGQRAARKVLLFCNTRHEVEQVAAYLRHHLPYFAQILVHYSNLDPLLRREVEEGFAAASVAICVSSSTLELGVDIGSVEEVALLGPPPTLSSLLQRVGRGARRRDETPVLCLARSPLETLRFHALFDLADEPAAAPPRSAPFRPSVLVQQAFSLLKGSPTGGLRLADLRRIAPDEVSNNDLRDILGHLVAEEWLRPGQPGEWRSTPKLDELVDLHEIYSNIGGEVLNATVVDAYSGKRIAQVERPRQKGETLLMGGQSQEVAWRDRFTFGVQQGKRSEADEVLRFRTAPFAVPFEVAQAMARHIGIAPGTVPRVLAGEEVWLFHGWGELYGEWLAALLQLHLDEDAPPVEPWNELCLHLPAPLSALPPWSEQVARAALRQILPRAAQHLELGRFHPLLPPTLAHQSTVSHLHPKRFEALYRTARITLPSARLREQLLELV